MAPVLLAMRCDRRWLLLMLMSSRLLAIYATRLYTNITIECRYVPDQSKAEADATHLLQGIMSWLPTYAVGASLMAPASGSLALF